MANPAKSFILQMQEFFGKLPGQTSIDFMKDVKRLSDAERASFTDMLNKAGYPVLDKPAATATA